MAYLGELVEARFQSAEGFAPYTVTGLVIDEDTETNKVVVVNNLGDRWYLCTVSRILDERDFEPRLRHAYMHLRMAFGVKPPLKTHETIFSGEEISIDRVVGRGLFNETGVVFIVYREGSEWFRATGDQLKRLGFYIATAEADGKLGEW